MTDQTVRFPHCDSNVLHRPGACVYCDEFPQRQLDRRMRRINFTGENKPDRSPCPSTATRPLEVIERWPGNRAALPTFLRGAVEDPNIEGGLRSEADEEFRTRITASLKATATGSLQAIEYAVTDAIEQARPAGSSMDDIRFELAYQWLVEQRPRGFWKRLHWVATFAMDLLGAIDAPRRQRRRAARMAVRR
jgi:hypothetical protein